MALGTVLAGMAMGFGKGFGNKRIRNPVRRPVAAAILNKSQNQVRLQAIEGRNNSTEIDTAKIPARNTVKDSVRIQSVKQ